MKALTIVTVLAGSTIALLTADAGACGESLFRVGKGVSFRQYTAPLPGSIVIVAQTPAELALAEQLAEAGHDVHVISEPKEIGEALQHNDVDIVLAFFSQRNEVQTQAGIASVSFVPVAVDGTDEVAAARQMYEHSLTNDDSLKTFLKTIHRTLKSKT